jgi:hypothetical protein
MGIENQASGPATGNPGSGPVEGAGAASSPATDFISDTAGSGQDQTLSAPAQAGQPAKEAEAVKATPVLAGWTSATTKELRADPRFNDYASKFKSVDDVVKSAMELESKAGSMVSIPGEKSTPEERAAYYERMGVPKEPDGYEFEKDPSIEYDEADLASFKALAHELHLSQDQAKAMFAKASESAGSLLKGNQEQQAAAAKQEAEARAQEKTDVEKTLRKEWGGDYNVNRELVKRGIARFASPELLALASAKGMGNQPSFIRMFQQLGSLVREDSALLDGSGGSSRKNIADVMYPKG